LFTTLDYIALVLLLRLGGKGMLANMDEFDLAVTVAVASTLANLVSLPMLRGLKAPRRSRF
jgi:uncharacterized membrane protein YcaP (DUF421 family)